MSIYARQATLGNMRQACSGCICWHQIIHTTFRGNLQSSFELLNLVRFNFICAANCFANSILWNHVAWHACVLLGQPYRSSAGVSPRQYLRI